MSDKLKLTKDSLSREKKDLTRFSRFLPTLQLRKQQLFNEIHRIRQGVKEREDMLSELQSDVARWTAVFAENIDLSELFVVKRAVVRTDNVAGIEIPVLESVDVEETAHDLMELPFWVDAGLRALKEVVSAKLHLSVLREQLRIISDELTTTVQRINLFEKVKIPQAKENIRRIRIFLGDQQTAGVVRGKMTKGKLVKKRKARKSLVRT
ncbi:MAG: V-type ATP synthase subunit D [Lentisphaeria bacterium]|nr:V-type ATP synthase subunit D [Lentisphaeria bacterium]